MKVALIDGDVVAYRFASAEETAIEWEDGLWTLHADLDAAFVGVAAFINSVKEEAGCEEVQVFFSSSTNFRKIVLPTYKSNRKAVRKPMILAELRKRLMASYGSRALEVYGLEADDLLGLNGYRRSSRVICTIDKDLRTVEGFHYNWDKPEEGVVKVDAREAALQFYGQVLTGDATDGYKGCPGVGPKTAAKLLASCESSTDMWSAVVKAYEKAGLDEEEALTQARVAYILKREGVDYDAQKEQVIQWTPTLK